MKSKLILYILALDCMTAASMANMRAQDRVNIHLKKMQTIIDNKDSEARLKMKQPPQIDPASTHGEVWLQNSPSFGIGDDSVNPLFEVENTFSDETPILTPEEKIRRELERRELSSTTTSSLKNTNETHVDANKQFIEEFKANAKSKGVILEVNPVTYEVKRIK